MIGHAVDHHLDVAGHGVTAGTKVLLLSGYGEGKITVTTFPGITGECQTKWTESAVGKCNRDSLHGKS